MVRTRIPGPRAHMPVRTQPHIHRWTDARTVPIELTYQFGLKEARRLVRETVQTMLVEATGNPNAKMPWTLEERTMAQKSIFKYRVELCGWLPHITFQSPGHISSLRQLGAILMGLRRGEIYFRRMTYEEVYERNVVLCLESTESRRARRDIWTVRQLRPVETRSKRLRKFTGIKTGELVDDEIEEWDA